MQILTRTAAAVALGLVVGANAARAQIDYRNLDAERPLFTEDAYPIEQFAFELLAPYRFEQEAQGEEVHRFGPELEYGVIANGQIGLELPIAHVSEGSTGDSEWGLAGLELFGFYNLNTESRSFPAFALRADVHLPIGGLAGDGARVALRAIATRSWGRTRLHFNAVRGFGGDASPGADPLSRWAYSLAADRTLFRRSILLLGEAYVRREVSEAPVEVNVAAGARYQWTPTVVVDAGLTRRLRGAAGPDLALTVGLSYTFAVRGLMPGVR